MVEQFDVGREVERIYALMNGIAEETEQAEQAEQATPQNELSESDKNWLQWREVIERDPKGGLQLLSQSLGVESFGDSEPSPTTEEENPLDYLDEYTRKAVETLVQQMIAPYTEMLQMLANSAQAFYYEQVKQSAVEQIRNQHARVSGILGDLQENDIAEIINLAINRFDWNIEDAYNYWSAPRLRAALEKRTAPREVTPEPTGNVSPGDLLRALQSEYGR